MGFRVLLVRVPSFPFTIETFLPDERLAKASALLCAEGHAAEITDLGAPATLACIYPPEFRDRNAQWVAKSDSADNWTTPLGTEAENTAFEHALIERYAALARDVITKRSRDRFDVWVLRLDTSAEAYAPIWSRGLRDAFPGVPILLWRDCTQPCTSARHKHGEVLFAHGEENEAAREVSRVLRDGLDSAGCNELHGYDEAVYPGLAHNSKVMLFTVAEQSGPSSGRITADAMGHLLRKFGVCIFYVRGCASFGNQVEALASELLNRRLAIRYGRDASIAATSPATLAALHASGCESLMFQVDSGSQRLIDDHFESAFTVSLAERVVKTARCAGFYTVAGITYPCVHDDVHTRAETLRWVDRARPHAIALGSDGPGVASRSVQERHSLRTALRAMDIETVADGREALLGTLYASLPLFGGRPEQLAMHIRNWVYTGDVDSLAHLIETFNDAVRISPQASEYRPFAAHRRAVGN